MDAVNMGQDTANVQDAAQNDESELAGFLQRFDWSGSVLQDHEKERLHALLTQHRSLFAFGPEDLGRTNMTEHRIDTQGAHPIRQQSRRQPHSLLPETQAQTRSMLEREVINPSYASSPWAASPIVLVKKRNGTYRFCVDYRRLNAVTVKDSYPFLDNLDGATIFTTLYT